MMNKIEIEDYSEDHLNEVVNIIKTTWDYDSYFVGNNSFYTAKIYVLEGLSNSSFAKVAKINGKVAGIIMGRSEHHKKFNLKYKFKMLFYTFLVLLNKEGRSAIKEFSKFSNINQNLLNNNNKDYYGELVLFAIDENIRGFGIGRKLYEEFLNYAKNEKMKNFYLFTDTECNYKFYEHMGMKRQGQIFEIIYNRFKKIPINFYMYTVDLR